MQQGTQVQLKVHPEVKGSVSGTAPGKFRVTWQQWEKGKREPRIRMWYPFGNKFVEAASVS